MLGGLFDKVFDKDEEEGEAPRVEPPEEIRDEGGNAQKSQIPAGFYTQYEAPLAGPVGSVAPPPRPYEPTRASLVGSMKPDAKFGTTRTGPAKKGRESGGDDVESEDDIASLVRELGSLAVEKAERMKPPFWKPNATPEYSLKEDKFDLRMGLEKDMFSIKAFLQRQEKSPHIINIYDHLSAILDKIITEHPPDAGEIYEEISRMIRATRFIPQTDHLQDIYIPPLYMHSESILRILKTVQQPVSSREVSDADAQKSANYIELIGYFERVGVNLPRLHTFCIRIALNNLARTHHLKSYRLWGTIMGIYGNYIIAETELFPTDIQLMQEDAEEEERKREEAEEKKMERMREKIVDAVLPKELLKDLERYGEGEEIGGEDLFPPPPKPPPEFPPLPQPVIEKVVEIPVEKRGEGVNTKVYFVATNPSEDWVMLPDVTPQQIQAARKIRKYFTGDLNTEIHTYPRFPGKEINLLRAQIARISASTLVSPKGFFKLEGRTGEEALSEEEESLVDEEESDIEGGARGEKKIVENPNFKPKPTRELLLLENWVHHNDAILEQGRTKFWDAERAEMPGEDFMDEEMSDLEEDEGKKGQKKKEIPPPIFRSLNHDESPILKTLWSTQTSTNLFPELAIVLIRSELWPGAYAFSSERKFENLYIGWGLKNTPSNLSIPPMPVVSTEYPTGPEIMEINDPTWAEEEAWRIAHMPKPPPPREEIGEGGEEVGEELEEEEEEEEEDEDED